MEKRLIELLQKTQISIAKGKIRTEKDLVAFACNATKSENLFRLMGYKASEVQIQPNRVHIGPGVAKFKPDFILRYGPQDIIVFDAKAPGVELDKHIYQIVSYCEKTETPLGVLFNGNCIHVFANTKIPKQKWLTQIKCPTVRYKGFSSDKIIKGTISFFDDPIAAVQGPPHQLATILLALSKTSMEQGASCVASRMAKKRARDIALGAVIDLRDHTIRNQLDKIKAAPSKAILRAVRDSNPRLTLLRPTENELLRNWLPVPLPPKNAAHKAWETRRANQQAMKEGQSKAD